MVILKEFYDCDFPLCWPSKLSFHFQVSYPIIPKCDHIQKLFPKLNLVTNISDIINLLPCYNVPIKSKQEISC